MKIGNIDLGERPLFLAPMEDVTDIGFRKLCKRFGADMMYTEFVSADAIIRSIKSTLDKMRIDEDERPVGIQILRTRRGGHGRGGQNRGERAAGHHRFRTSAAR